MRRDPVPTEGDAGGSPSSGSAAAAVGLSPRWLEPFTSRAEASLRRALSMEGLPGISEGVVAQIESGGKRLRPSTTLWIGERLGAAADPLESWAVAVELLHNVFLIHDDIEDGDTYRRGRPTLWAARGIEEALNVSDYLVAEAFRNVAEAGAVADCAAGLARVFAATFRITVEGQALDLAWRARESFTLADYDEIIRKKTGRYLALGWVGAALIAGRGRDSDVDGLWRVGEELGPAFQIRDDVLDLTVGKGRGGEIGCDIREGKPSILFAHALAAPRDPRDRPPLSSEERTRLVEILARPRRDTSAADVEEVVELYRRAGSIEYAEAEAQKRAEAAVGEFSRLPWAAPPFVREFQSLADFVRGRTT